MNRLQSNTEQIVDNVLLKAKKFGLFILLLDTYYVTRYNKSYYVIRNKMILKKGTQGGIY